jgi:hypothetical protein
LFFISVRQTGASRRVRRPTVGENPSAKR